MSSWHKRLAALLLLSALRASCYRRDTTRGHVMLQTQTNLGGTSVTEADQTPAVRDLLHLASSATPQSKENEANVRSSLITELQDKYSTKSSESDKHADSTSDIVEPSRDFSYVTGAIEKKVSSAGPDGGKTGGAGPSGGPAAGATTERGGPNAGANGGNNEMETSSAGPGGGKGANATNADEGTDETVTPSAGGEEDSSQGTAEKNAPSAGGQDDSNKGTDATAEGEEDSSKGNSESSTVPAQSEGGKEDTSSSTSGPKDDLDERDSTSGESEDADIEEKVPSVTRSDRALKGGPEDARPTTTQIGSTLTTHLDPTQAPPESYKVIDHDYKSRTDREDVGASNDKSRIDPEDVGTSNIDRHDYKSDWGKEWKEDLNNLKTRQASATTKPVSTSTLFPTKSPQSRAGDCSVNVVLLAVTTALAVQWAWC